MQFRNGALSNSAVDKHHEGVEPAARLADILDDEVAREMAARTSPCSRMDNGPARTASSPIRTSSRARPRHAPHDGLARRVVRVGPCQLVDIGAMQVLRPDAEIALDLVE